MEGKTKRTGEQREWRERQKEDRKNRGIGTAEGKTKRRQKEQGDKKKTERTGEQGQQREKQKHPSPTCAFDGKRHCLEFFLHANSVCLKPQHTIGVVALHDGHC